MAKDNEVKNKSIYIASKTKHANKWIALRESGINIISTWIDEAGIGQTKDMECLCRRCVIESSECDAMIVYAEEGDYLKGAFIEMGIAIAAGKSIYLVGSVLPYGSVFTHHDKVNIVHSVQEAIELLDNQFIKPTTNDKR